MTKIRIFVLALAFMLLIPAGALASGIQISDIRANVEYDDAYAIRLEKVDQNRDRASFVTVPAVNGSVINADIFPGSNVTFTVDMENTLQGRDRDLRNVVARVSIKKIDNGADLQDESVDFDLGQGNDAKGDVKLSIPVDADMGTYKTVIEAEGEDQNNTLFRDEVDLKLVVKRLSHDLRVERISLNPGTANCSRKITITADAVNAGLNKEDNVAIEFKSPSLGINSADNNIHLGILTGLSGEEKSHTKTLAFEVPKFFSAGSYPITINLYWNKFILFDQKTVYLNVNDCASYSATPVQQGQNITGQPAAQPEAQQNFGQELVTATEEISIANSPVLLSVFFGGFAVTALAILAIAGYLKSKVQ